jgi:hypothetical protein
MTQSEENDLDIKCCHKAAKVFHLQLKKVSKVKHIGRPEDARNKALSMSRTILRYRVLGKMKKILKMMDKKGFKILMTDENRSLYSKDMEFNGKRHALQVDVLMIPGALVCKFFVGLPKKRKVDLTEARAAIHEAAVVNAR